MILQEKKIPVCLVSSSDDSYEFVPVSPDCEVTHIFCIKYYYVFNTVYYYVSSVINVRLGGYLPFKPVTLSTDVDYDSAIVDSALFQLCHSRYSPFLHSVMTYIHSEMQDVASAKE